MATLGSDGGTRQRDARRRVFYLEVLAEQATACGCAVHAYVLMTNHVHLLLTPISC